ncbi:hypothetical protein IWQ61_000392 [Dispira simplex]|nr:hypothetical protein IWQ61_000392 [Dispira simplex]
MKRKLVSTEDPHLQIAQFRKQLATPEAVAEWIQQRKNRYPTLAKRSQPVPATTSKPTRPSPTQALLDLCAYASSDAESGSGSDVDPILDALPAKVPSASPPIQLCQQFRRGRCPRGKRCPFVHPTSKEQSINLPRSDLSAQGLFRRRGLRQQLLATDIRRDLKIVLCCLRFINDHHGSPVTTKSIASTKRPLIREMS